MDLQSTVKIPRKREPNFTAEEKAFLARLVKKRPIVESKQIDGKVVEQKKAAWDSITLEFNSNLHVHKRDTLVLKRAWDNMKAVIRKASAAQRGNLIRTGGGPILPPQPSQQGAQVTSVKEATPVTKSEIDNDFDSDGAFLHKENLGTMKPAMFFLNQETAGNNSQEVLEPSLHVCGDTHPENSLPALEKPSQETARSQMRRPQDYVRQEAVMRIKHFDYKKKMEKRILKAKLEIEEIKKQNAMLEQEKVKLEIEEIKKRLEK